MFVTQLIFMSKGNTMTANAAYRRTAIWVATLWLLTAFGAIAGTGLMNSVLNAPDYLSTAFPGRTTVIIGMLLWFINDFGIVLIGILMFPILKMRSERMALTYLSMRMFEAIFLVVGVIFAMLLIPLSQAFIQGGAPNATSYEALGSVLKEAEYWFMTPMQLIPLGLGGVVLTFFLYQTRLVPRSISIVGLVGYGLLVPITILNLLGILDTSSGALASLLVIPVAAFEVILMPIWLYAKGFNASAIASESATTAPNALLSAA